MIELKVSGNICPSYITYSNKMMKKRYTLKNFRNTFLIQSKHAQFWEQGHWYCQNEKYTPEQRFYTQDG